MALQTSVTIAGEKCLGDANNGYVFAIVPQVLIYYGGIILCFKSSRSVAKNSFHSEESDAEAGYRECIFRLGTVVSSGGLRLFRRD